MTSVIIIDDEFGLVEMIEEFLLDNDIEVLATGINGKDAVDLCLKHSPDYLLLDLNMDEYDGFYALEKLSESSILPKVIVISGMIGPELEKLKQYNDLTLLPKPFDIGKIVDLVKN